MKAKLLLLLVCLLAFSGTVCAVNEPAKDNGHVAEMVAASESGSSGFVAKALHWYDQHMNYVAVGLLMVVESSFIPFPSEVIIPPAVYVACNPESESGMVIWLIVVIGTLGAVVGAFVNYYLAVFLGRPIVYKFVDSKLGHLCGLSGEKMQRAEDYFKKYGASTTLIGRFIPGIRQLISIPAGLAKMNVGSFAFYTAVGACGWNCILALLGWIAYKAADPDVIAKYSHQLSVIILVLLVILLVFFIVKAIAKNRKKRNNA